MHWEPIIWPRSTAIQSALVLMLALPAMDANAQFNDVTAAAGLDHVQITTLGTPNPPMQMQHAFAGGAAAGDYNRDGFVDLIVTRLDAPPILYQGDGTSFTDVTVAAGLDVAQPFGSNAAAWGDIDNDGDLDLYVTATFDGITEATRFFLYLNNGDDGSGQYTFTEVAVARGADITGTDPHYGQSVAFGDYDRDGFLDIYVGEWRPEYLAPGIPSNSRLLHNLGDANPGFFEDVTIAAGLTLEGIDGGQVDGVFVFAPRFSDLDGDGYPDLTLVSDFFESTLFWNNGDGSFTNGTTSAGVGGDENGMGATIADFDGDGDLDWFISSLFSEPAEGLDRPIGNRLYLNDGDRTFTDVTATSGVVDSDWGWGASDIDFDNDGDVDIVQTNGIHWRAGEPWTTDPMRMWRNDGNGAGGVPIFTDVAGAMGMTDTGLGKGILTFDYDNDGDLDVYVVNYGGAPTLYRNDDASGNNWLKIKLTGTTSNRDGIGALITVTPDLSVPGEIMIREVDGGSNFLSQDDMTVHVGLGAAGATIDEITIRWPSGIEQVFTDVANNTLLDAVEPVVDLADLSMGVTVDVATPAVGDDVVFTMTLTNDGPDEVTGVTVNVPLATGYTYNGVFNGSGWDGAGTWTVASLASGTSTTLDLTLEVNAAGIYTQTAEVIAADQTDPDSTPGDGLGDDFGSAITIPEGTAGDSADLSLVMTVDNAEPNVGAEVVFTMTLTNDGPDDATGVDVIVPLSSGYTYNGVFTGSGWNNAGMWSVASLASGTSTSMTFTLEVNPDGDYTMTAEVTAADQTDPDSTPGDGGGDDSTSATTVPVAGGGESADLSLEMTVDNAAPNVGDQVVFTMTLTNDGPDDATGVDVIVPLSSGYTYNGVFTGSGWNNAGTWSVASLASGTSTSMTFTVEVNPDGDYTMTAEVTAADQTDPDSTPGDGGGDDSTSATTVPVAGGGESADLSLEMTVDNAAPNVGDEVVFTMTLTNDGPDDATGVDVFVPLSSGYTYNGIFTGSGWNNAGTWSVASLASGTSTSMTFTLEVDPNGNYTMTAEVIDAGQTDPDSTPGDGTGDDFGSASTTPQ